MAAGINTPDGICAISLMPTVIGWELIIIPDFL
jgi:hypothetical protein